jgi:flavin-dependent dehydrogenase
MAMAIHSAKIVSELVGEFCQNKIKSREELEKRYIQEWKGNFENRIKTGRILTFILQKQKFYKFLMKIMIKFPFLIPIIIKQTHGKLIAID